MAISGKVRKIVAEDINFGTEQVVIEKSDGTTVNANQVNALHIPTSEGRNVEQIIKGVGFSIDEFDGLADAVAKIGSQEATLVIHKPVTLNQDLTIPENICLKFLKGGKIIVNDGYTLTVNGAIEAGLWKIFDGDGTITGNPKIDAVYPEWFGAVGDGLSDDIFAIQKAVSFADCVILSKKYTISSSIVIENAKNKEIIGRNNSFIKLLPLSDTPTDFKQGNVFYIDNVDNIIIDGVHIDGNKDNQPASNNEIRGYFAGIHVGTANNLIICNCIIENIVSGAGIESSELVGGNIFNNRIINCGRISEGNICDGIFTGLYSKDNVIKNNYIENCTDYGIANDTNFITVEGNTIISCNSAGIGGAAKIGVGKHIKIINNVIKDCTRPINFFALDNSNTEGFYDIQIINNIIEGADFACIFLTGNGYVLGQDFVIIGNKINTLGGSYTGISVIGSNSYYAKNILIKDNVIYGANKTDLQSSIASIYTENVTIENNIIYQYDFGIYIKNTKNIKVKSNIINVLRDAIIIKGSDVFFDQVFKDVPRNSVILSEISSKIYGTVTFINCNNPLNAEGGACIHTKDVSHMIMLDNLTSIDSNYVIFDSSGVTQTVRIKKFFLNKEWDSNVFQSDWNVAISAPSSGKWSKGDFVVKVYPYVDTNSMILIGWICVKSGDFSVSGEEPVFSPVYVSASSPAV